MVFILIGMGALLLLLVSDWADCAGRMGARLLAAVVSLALLLSAAVALMVRPERLALPMWARLPAALAAALFLFLLASSLFLEIQLAEGPDGERPLYTRGTYALVRHPGVLWLALFQVCLALAIRSEPLLFAVPFWTASNVALVAVEDKIFFPRLFGDAYRRYQKNVPFLIPNRSSIKNCITTYSIKQVQKKVQEATHGDD
jgi:protein-S-isoprenylcysteine O-methyltransferase Ste14